MFYFRSIFILLEKLRVIYLSFVVILFIYLKNGYETPKDGKCVIIPSKKLDEENKKQYKLAPLTCIFRTR